MAQHTPGPWKYNENYDQSDTLIYGPNKEPVIAFDAGSYDAEPTATITDADGSLIATSPRLLEALKPLAFSDKDNPPSGIAPDDWKQAVLEARAALREARGE